MNGRRSVIGLTAVALAPWVAAVAGCDVQPVPPAVVCQDQKLEYQRTFIAGAGGNCSAPTKATFDVVHTVIGQSETVGAYDGLAVRVSRATPVVQLCEGSGCTPNADSLDTSTDEFATLRYTVSVDLNLVGLPAEGASSTFGGDAVLESYGPGSACPVKLAISITCATSTSGGTFAP